MARTPPALDELAEHRTLLKDGQALVSGKRGTTRPARESRLGGDLVISLPPGQPQKLGMEAGTPADWFHSALWTLAMLRTANPAADTIPSSTWHTMINDVDHRLLPRSEGIRDARLPGRALTPLVFSAPTRKTLSVRLRGQAGVRSPVRSRSSACSPACGSPLRAIQSAASFIVPGSSRARGREPTGPSSAGVDPLPFRDRKL